MKKSVNMLATAGVVGLMLASTNAVANIDNLKFYAGAGVNYGKYNIGRDLKSKMSPNTKLKNKGFGALVPVIGVKFCDNFAVEAGYSFNKKISFKETGVTSDQRFKVRNAYVDFIANAPVVDQLDVVGGVGISKLMLKKSKDITSEIKNKLGVRVKAGVQYNFNNNIGTRALAVYQTSGSKITDTKVNNVKFVKNYTSVNLDVLYTF